MALTLLGVTIHRVGPAATPYRQSLGRVLVTIDDLNALMDLIRSNLGSGEELKIQFDGGYFTTAEDLRQLSDEELKSIRIQTSSLEVRLDETQCVAIGKEQHAEEIYRLWARARSTRGLDNTKLLERARALLTMGAITLAAFVIFVITVDPFIPDGGTFGSQVDTFIPNEVQALIGLAVAFGVASLAGGTILRLFLLTYNVPHVAIKPMSLHEYRQLQATNKYPRLAWIVAAVSVVVAIVAIIAPLVFK